MSLLSEHRAEWLLQALRSAQTLVTMALRGEAYAMNFAKANYYTHVGVAFAARMVIRLTSLMPDAVDLRQTGRDLEAVTKILAQGASPVSYFDALELMTVPGFQFAQQIRDILRRARRKHVLPPPSRASPTSGSVPLPPLSDHPLPTSGAPQALSSGSGSVSGGAGTNTNAGTSAGGGAGATLMSGPPTATPEGLPLDFFLAEQLFSNGPVPGEMDMDMPLLGPPDETLALEQWFPYPPLEVSPGRTAWGAGW